MKSVLKFWFQFLFNLVNIIAQLLPDNYRGNKLRGVLLRLFFRKVGKNLQISKSVHFLYPRNISFGDDVFIGFNCWVNGQGGLDIEDEVMFGPFCAVSTSNHTRAEGQQSFRFGQHELGKVTVRAGAWVAANVSITAGSEISKGAIIGAGSTVVGILEKNNCLYIGSPAKLKKELS
ncbi:hypothetical protein A3740_11715 [Oleiphilus sp. HI0068]|nr:hypothetical protein A3740_11715 [Oleiphilus sp. HI0068]KZY85782.1 hypothetical protein A3741_14975 [Oleiphilus sp. HI0069]